MCVNILYIIISDNQYVYGKFALEKHKISKLEAGNDTQTQPKAFRVKLDAVFVHYFLKELLLSRVYCENFYRRIPGSVVLVLKDTKVDLVDYGWNSRINYLVRERCELDHTLSWLSTLGGAFSALGDYFTTCAETAGKISVHQLKLAMRLNDPNIAARCRLFLSLSFIQRRQFKLAKRIISQEYENAKNQVVVDTRLVRMCVGIWSKLQYEVKVRRQKVQRVIWGKLE